MNSTTTAAGKSPLHLSRATLADALWVADHMRHGDRAGISAATDQPCRELLEKSIEVSKAAFTVRAEKGGSPLALFGVADAGMLEIDDLYDDSKKTALLVGSIWQVGTDELDELECSVAEEASSWLDLLGENYDVLVSTIWSGQDSHQEWLTRSGFHLHNIVCLGPRKQVFYSFYRLTEECQSKCV